MPTPLIKQTEQTPGQLMMSFSEGATSTEPTLNLTKSMIIGLGKVISAKGQIYLALNYDLISGDLTRGAIDFDQEAIAQFAARWSMELSQKVIRNHLLALADKGYLEEANVDLSFTL
jgi:hypothetical protein